MRLARTLWSLLPAVLCAAAWRAFATRGIADDGWETDFKAAQAKAKAGKKYMLVDFTGSDWCGWCIKLHEEVFDKEPFKAEGPKRFVLVELDYPHQKKQSDELKKQNKELSEKYGIEGFPTVLLMDAEGLVIAKTGYRPGGPEEYLKHLAEFTKVYDEILAMRGKLDKSQGLDRAKLLDSILEGYAKLDNEPKEASAWMKEIIKLDPDNKTGLRVKYEFRDLIVEADKLKKEQKFDESLKIYEKALGLKGVEGEQRQDAYLAVGECYFMKHDFAGLVKCLEKGLEAAPKSEKAKQLENMIVRFGKTAKAQEAVAKVEAEAKDLKGLDRAKALDKLVDAKLELNRVMPEENGADAVKKLTAEIVKLDAENKAGLKRKYEFRAPVNEAVDLLHQGQPEDAMPLLDKALETKDITPDEAQEVQMYKAQCYLTEQKADEAKECLMKALEVSPKGPRAAEIKTLIRKLDAVKKKEKKADE